MNLETRRSIRLRSNADPKGRPASINSRIDIEDETHQLPIGHIEAN